MRVERVSVEEFEKSDAVSVEDFGTFEKKRVDNVENVVERQRFEDPPLPVVEHLEALLWIVRVLVEALDQVVVSGMRIFLGVSSNNNTRKKLFSKSILLRFYLFYVLIF